MAAPISDSEPPTANSNRSATPIDAHIGNRIRLRRMLLGLSQEAMAEHLSMSYQQIQKYETGVNRVSAARLFKLCQILDVSPGYFYADMNGAASDADAPDQQIPNSIELLMATPQGVHLLTAFAAVKNAKARRAIITLVETMANAEKSEN